MRKYAYLAKLEELLAALPVQERQDALNYYEEYFDAAGNDKEEQTAEELGDPAVVARKILEEEGFAEVSPEPKEQSAPEVPAQPAEPEKEETKTEEETDTVDPPTGPEPPKLEHPEEYPTKGVEKQQKASGNRTRKLWLIFWLLVALALVVQLSVLLLGMGNFGGSSASMAASSVEYACSEAVVEPSQSEPASTSMEASGAVTYSGTLDTPGKGTLFVTLTRGNLVFKTGEQASVEVHSVDVNDNVSYEQTVDQGYAFVCNSTDPNAHVTITLPADAYDKLEVRISTSGAIELGDLQMREISAYTASGPIQSDKLRVQKLTAQTDIGNIWLEKVADGVDYQVEEVNLQAPSGSVGASFSATRDQWKTDITAPDGVVESMGTNEESTKYTRTLQVLAASTVNLKYGEG